MADRGALTIIGFIAVFGMMACDFLERLDPRWALAFALFCFLSSGYAAAVGSWPFMFVEAFWGAMKLYEFRKDTRGKSNVG